MLLLFFLFLRGVPCNFSCKNLDLLKIAGKKNKYSDAFPIDSPNGGLNNAVLKKKMPTRQIQEMRGYLDSLWRAHLVSKSTPETHRSIVPWHWNWRERRASKHTTCQHSAAPSYVITNGMLAILSILGFYVMPRVQGLAFAPLPSSYQATNQSETSRNHHDWKLISW